MKSFLREIRLRSYEKVMIRIANFMTISHTLQMSRIKIQILKLIGMKIANPCFIDDGFSCLNPRNISIDRCCSFGHDNKFWAFSRIRIGPYVQSALGLTLVAGGHNAADYSPLVVNQEIVIEGENWIGANVTIIGGVRIGRGSIIAAGAVVTKDIPPYSIAAGVPAKVVKARLPSEYVVSPFGNYKPTI